MSPDSALLLVLIVLLAIFTILFIMLKVLAEMFTNCWLDSKCWFIPRLEVIPN